MIRGYFWTDEHIFCPLCSVTMLGLCSALGANSSPKGHVPPTFLRHDLAPCRTLSCSGCGHYRCLSFWITPLRRALFLVWLAAIGYYLNLAKWKLWDPGPVHCVHGSLGPSGSEFGQPPVGQAQFVRSELKQVKDTLKAALEKLRCLGNPHLLRCCSGASTFVQLLRIATLYRMCFPFEFSHF